ncbi:Sodium:sulfate symporter transmembrane region family protein [Tritrichomonas foetus]|uniref:Sodium:sulfate symporter transmembrane region family protein n=1 Tax=Tritrichomonas foetus TaxID=1144522 RepID=A0A1J4KH81_9EUKA|nr:Sodium:sulfate symporter transmembrane region family protein [Tritrichomonas foetus]|eukprot:OHT10547.1 Sodium:sulfate symporter transmembrane region family protein [Tritrichomonas foetus]
MIDLIEYLCQFRLKPAVKTVIWWLQLLIPILIAVFFLFSVVTLDKEKPKASACLGVTIITACWWIFEPIPIVITAFFPVFLLPLFGVSKGGDIASAMFSDTSLVFLGGFIFSTAMVRWNLHSRIALKTVLIFGLKPRVLLAGIMIVTAFLSMWISNTATALTMVPNALAIVTKLEEITGDPVVVEPFSKSLFLAIAFSASVGGMATLIGTPPNLILAQIAKSTFPQAPEIGFAQFLFVALPTTVVIIVVMYLFFVFFYMRKLKMPEDVDESAFRDNYEKLGPMKPAEKIVGLMFIILALLWLFRGNLSFGPSATLKGWATLLLGSSGTKYITDGTVAIALAMLLFIIKVPQPNVEEEKKLIKEEVDLEIGHKPVEWNRNSDTELIGHEEDADGELLEEMTEEELLYIDPKSEPAKPWVAILDWEYAQQKIPWTILFLFSGGFALNQGFTDSKLNVWMGDMLKGLGELNLFVLLLCVCFVTALLSNIASNAACANILFPVVAMIAQKAGKYHPWLLMIPCAFSTSTCFIMPVATPPNLVCYGSGRLVMKDFMIAGSILNVVSVFIVIGMSMALVPAVFDAHEFPSWA